LDLDVVIIGAGTAGLSAAKSLRDRGRRVAVIEGSHRIGGRAYSEEIAPGTWFDLGCSYLHQAEHNPFVGIADELNHEIGKAHGKMFERNNMHRHAYGRQLAGDAQARLFTYLGKCDAAVAASVEAGRDVAIAELVDLDNEFAPIYMASMASLNTLDLDQTSAADFYAASGGQDYPVKNGYGNLVAAWGADVEVALNHRVERIDCRGPGVRVHTAHGVLEASNALCTVSTGVLAAQQIDFQPALPDSKLAAIAGLPCGTENKICLFFERDIFGAEGRGFHLTWNDEIAGGFEASVMGQNTAIVFTGGRHAIWLEKQGQQASEEYALNMVASVFGNDIHQAFSRSICTAWTTEPWTYGSYSCALPGQAHQRAVLAQPIDSKLVFAGEATTVGDHACCHGAFNSGQRAAAEIDASLG
jgi:monoamine oxidase